MTLTIEKAKKEGNSDLLKFKGLLDGDYVIISKTDNFEEPITGEGQHGEWFLWNIHLHEYKMFDMATRLDDHKVYDEPLELGFFDDPKKAFHDALVEEPAGTKIKIFMVEGKQRRKYDYEIVADGEAPVKEAAPSTDDSDDIKAFLSKSKSVLSEEDLLNLAVSKFDVSKSLAKTIYDSL
jgi:hypothetical protein